MPGTNAVVNGSDDAPSLVGMVEKSLAGAAAAGALGYVYLNALYVEFYDDFGVRPEDVGVDRVAVLGRAAWLVLLGGVAVASVMASAQVARRLSHRGTVDGGGQGKRNLTVGVGLFIGILIMSFAVLRLLVHLATEEARRGERVGGIGWQIEFIDVRALPARIAWISDTPAPADLPTDEEFLYLGYGDEFVALIDCSGSTRLLKTSDVAVTIFGQDHELQACPKEDD